MLHGHELADNLFARLGRTKPHIKHSPLENFCTEALVSCLRNCEAFRDRFLKLCARQLRLKRGLPKTIAQISTQVAPRITARSKRVSTKGLKPGQFDIEIQYAEPEPCLIVLESKVDYPVKAAQLQRYLDYLKEVHGSDGYLLLLIPRRKFIPFEAENLPNGIVWWEDIYECARAEAGRTGMLAAGKRTPQTFLCDQFSQFLFSLGLNPVNIPKLSSSKLSAAPDAMHLVSAFKQLLLKLKLSSGLKAPRKHPELEYDEERSMTWYGLHLAKSEFSNGWVGLEFNHSDHRVHLCFSMTVPNGTKTTLGMTFHGSPQFIPVEDETWFELRQELEAPFNGSESEISNWILTTRTEMKEFAKRCRKQRSER